MGELETGKQTDPVKDAIDIATRSLEKSRELGKVPRHIPSGNYSIPDLSKNVEGVRTDWRQLIVIGNGFDLQCGLRSQFRHFFTPRFHVIEAIPDGRRETWERIVELTDLTLWDFILESNIGSLWCDIEGTIERWVLSSGVSGFSASSPAIRAAEYLKTCPFDGTERAGEWEEGNRDDSDRMYDNIARYIWARHPQAVAEGYNRKHFLGLLRVELAKLEYSFGAYLAGEVASNETYAGKCKKLYQAIAKDGMKSSDDFAVSTSVLSFNYTDQIDKVFDGGEDGVCVNIHGKLGGEIIFGIDGKDCMDNPNAVTFTKTFRLMRRGGSRTDKLISTANSANLEDATNVIKFYGHSLGKPDYSYFQSIFDGVDLYESKTVLAFYYPYQTGVGDEIKNEEWRTNLANMINDLLVNYGATMDNKDHGKNLMHKLLLEGRLIIRGLTA